jgi:hypothetical protein
VLGRNVLAFVFTTLALGGAFLAAHLASEAPQPLVQVHFQVEPVAAPAPALAMASQPLEIATVAQLAPIQDLSEPDSRKRRPVSRTPVLTAVPDFVPPAGVASPPERSLIRERFVQVDLGQFMPTFDAESPDSQPEPKTVALDLFEDVQLDVVLDRLDAVSSRPGSLIWLGHVKGVEGSDVTLVARGQAVQGVVHMPTGRQFEIAYAGDGVHRVVETDISGFPMEEVPFDPSIWEPDSDVVTRAFPASAAALEVIDLMVLYTPEARARAGGVDAIEARIEQAVSMANQAYENSEIGEAQRIVHIGEVDYVESAGLAAYPNALSAIARTDDDVMNEVHAFRDEYGADIVSLLIHDWTSCGLAFSGDPRQSWAEAYAFNVAYWACVGSTNILTHEIGHNQGLAHDPDNSGTPGVFPYSFGLQDPTHFHTVMAYGSRFGCTAPCPAITHFSNPDVTYEGRPTGIADEVDAARSLNETRLIVAAFREAVDGGGLDSGVDTDSDGMPDDMDNCLETANPDQTDTDIDGLGNACDADYNGDMVVNNEDLAIFRATYLKSQGDPEFNPAVDSDGDGVVGNLDFGLLRSQLGTTPGPSGLACAGEPLCQGS